MKFCVKLLAIFLVLATLATTIASCQLPTIMVPAKPGSTGNNTVVTPPSNNNGNHVSGVVVGNATAPYIGDVHVSAEVTPDENNQVPSEGVSLESATASATIPGGVQMEDGSTELALTINGIKDSTANIELAETDVSSSFDVHVSGVAESNLVPMEVKLLAAALKGLNSTSIKLYHVENGETVEMTYVPTNEPFTAHNQFKYDPATGDVTLYIASFSEIAIVNDTVNAWDGTRDYSWYKAEETQLYIANAQQLAGFSAIVGEMDGQTQDSFNGKTVTLIADINLGDDEANNVEGKIFYPIGYWNSEGTYEKTGTAISSGFYSFMGTFDGNGHTISNFYQNTWEMKGDHNWYDATLQYYRDGMGLFGKIYKGTVRNLTVKNFSSDGEIATTGVIAAYADGATFENISIFNCNPRVYNIGNGGIVGCVGWYAKDANLTTAFTNITVDNTNKISALWGSYDVACGGILGQYYPTSGQSSANYPVNAGITFTNCHVSAVMDVYNDVCANYQYYAYRYTGMLIGSVRENETIDGHVYPKMDGITANGCTVHFGTWNDYYYCEIIDNTTASYTHDYQMSRLTEIKAIDGTTITYLDGTTGTVPESGRANYVIVDYSKGHGTENATCYHFKDGAVWNHEDAGYHDGTDGGSIIDENGDGDPDLREDKQHIYLEFNNLFTGYGWGVTSVGLKTYENVNLQDKLADIEIGGGNVEGSETKFEFIYEGKLEIGKTYTLGELFAATGEGSAIKNNNVVVTISTATGKADFTYEMNIEDWTQSTLKLNTLGDVTITISDYYFCKSTTVTVNVDKAYKFESAITSDFLYRVGNMNAITLEKLFKVKDGFEDPSNVTITITNGSYTASAGNWKAGTLSFTGYTGIATISIKETINGVDYSYPCEIKVEIVDGKNVLTSNSLEGATANNIVLHCNIGSGFTVSGRYTFYGNGFTLNYIGNGQYLNNGLKQGVITVSENGAIDNLRIIAPVYPKAYMYYGYSALGDYVQGGPSTVEGDKTRYHYQLSSVVLKGNATLTNCYIYGGRNNVFVDTGNVTIKDTILECGTVANIQIQSDSNYTVTLENVTTIQYLVDSNVTGTTSAKMMGAGIIVGPETTTNPTIVLNGEFKQYNWVKATDEDTVSDKAAKKIINAAVNATEYNHDIDGTMYSNLGIIYMNESTANIDNNTNLPYVEGIISINGVNGKVYSVQNATEEQIYFDYANADRTTVNSYYEPQFSYPADLGGQYEAKTDDGDTFFYREGDTIKVMFVSGDTKEIDLGALVNIAKYTDQDLDTVIDVTDSKGNSVTVTNGKITLSAADEYTITYTVTDTLFYDKDGKTVTKSVNYSWNVTLSVSLKDKATPNAEFKFVTDNQKMGYYVKSSVFSTSVYQYIPFLAGLQIYDYNGQTEYLRFDGDNDFNKVASIEITNKYSGNDALIAVKLTDGGVITLQLLARADSGGGSTYTGSIKTSNNVIYFVNDGTTSESNKTTTEAYWYVDYYKFIGNNGVEITSTQQTFNSTGSSASTPSGSFSTTINYTVSYDANGGNCGQTTSYATSASTAVTLPTPTRSGYIFAGWYTAASGGERVGGAGESYTPSANITLYAQWGKPCDVTYDANGGTCGTASEKYTGTALTLPTPTRDGYNFMGWYDAANGGNKIGNAGDTYNPKGEITLYAQWQEKVTYTVTYNANGGSCSEGSKTSDVAMTLPTPTREHYTFNGWYTAASGGTRAGGAGDSYLPSGNITLYAQWTEMPKYTITIGDQSNATVTVDKNSTYEDDTVSVTVSFSQSNNRTLTVKDASGNTILYKSAAGTYTFTMPASNVTIEASSEKSCVTGDTLVMLADGTQKRIDEVTYEDQLLVWNFFTGDYDVVPAAIIFYHGDEVYDVVKLYFEDGTTVKVINNHGFYDVELDEFIFLDEKNADEYIGHKFVKVDGNGGRTEVALVGYEVVQEYTGCYSIQTAVHINFMVEGMFSLTIPPMDGWFDYFEIGEGMKYDEEKMQADIAKYGLYTYEDFAEYVTYEQFIAFNGPYLKVLVGRGVLTFEQILELIATYVV